MQAYIFPRAPDMALSHMILLDIVHVGIYHKGYLEGHRIIKIPYIESQGLFQLIEPPVDYAKLPVHTI